VALDLKVLVVPPAVEESEERRASPAALDPQASLARKERPALEDCREVLATLDYLV